MVLMADDADRVTGSGELTGRLLGLEDPGAGGVDHLHVGLAAHALQVVRGNPVGANDQRPTLHLVGQVGGLDAAVRKVSLDPWVVDKLTERGDVFPLVTGVLGLVDRQAHAIAEAGTLGDSHLGSGDCGHPPDSIGPVPYRPRCPSGRSAAISRMIRSVPAARVSRSSLPSSRCGRSKTGPMRIVTAVRCGNRLRPGKIRPVPVIPTGRSGTPARIAISAAPSFASPSTQTRERVPSGKMAIGRPSARCASAWRCAARSLSPRGTKKTPADRPSQPTSGQCPISSF